MDEHIEIENVKAQIGRLPAGRLADTAQPYQGDDGTMCLLMSCGRCDEPVAVLMMDPLTMRELAAEIIEMCNAMAS